MIDIRSLSKPTKWFAVSLLAAVIVAVLSRTAAAQPEGDIDSGHRIAETWCRTCHIIGPEQQRGTSTGAPTFTEIAQMKSTTPMGLKVFSADAARADAGFASQSCRNERPCRVYRQSAAVVARAVPIIPRSEGTVAPGRAARRRDTKEFPVTRRIAAVVALRAGIVCKKKPWAIDKGPGNRDPLLLATGKLAWRVPLPFAKAQLPQHRPRPLKDVPAVPLRRRRSNRAANQHSRGRWCATTHQGSCSVAAPGCRPQYWPYLSAEAQPFANPPMKWPLRRAGLDLRPLRRSDHMPWINTVGGSAALGARRNHHRHRRSRDDRGHRHCS